MKVLKGFLIALCLAVLPINGHAADDHGHDHGHHDHGDHDDHDEESSMDLPQKTQELVGLKTQAVEAAAFGEKIPVTGRIAQDVEDVTEVFATENGRLKECPAPLGAVVLKDQVICRIENKSLQVIEIKAPSSGIIMADYAEVGEEIDINSPLHAIADLSALAANFDVYENDSVKVKMGQEVLVYSTAYKDRTFKGKIIFISPRIDETSFTIKLRVTIANPDLLLKPGMFVRGEIIAGDGQGQWVVPTEAVQNVKAANVVFVQDKRESFVPTKIDVKFESQGKSFVDGGLKAGDVVVTEGAYMLKSKLLEGEMSHEHSH